MSYISTRTDPQYKNNAIGLPTLSHMVSKRHWGSTRQWSKFNFDDNETQCFFHVTTHKIKWVIYSAGFSKIDIKGKRRLQTEGIILISVSGSGLTLDYPWRYVIRPWRYAVRPWRYVVRPRRYAVRPWRYVVRLRRYVYTRKCHIYTNRHPHTHTHTPPWLHRLLACPRQVNQTWLAIRVVIIHLYFMTSFVHACYFCHWRVLLKLSHRVPRSFPFQCLLLVTRLVIQLK